MLHPRALSAVKVKCSPRSASNSVMPHSAAVVSSENDDNDDGDDGEWMTELSAHTSSKLISFPFSFIHSSPSPYQMDNDISAYTYERTLMMEQRNQMLRELGLNKRDIRGVVSWNHFYFFVQFYEFSEYLPWDVYHFVALLFFLVTNWHSTSLMIIKDGGLYINRKSISVLVASHHLSDDMSSSLYPIECHCRCRHIKFELSANIAQLANEMKSDGFASDLSIWACVVLPSST